MSQRTQGKNKWNIQSKADFLKTIKEKEIVYQGERKYVVSTKQKEEKNIMSKDAKGKKKTF